MNISQSHNFRKISDNLTTSGSLPIEALVNLADSQGYQAVINLLPHDNKHTIAEEQTLVESQGMVYIQIPVEWEDPTEENYSDFVTAVNQTKNHKTHIHCAANWRVSGFYAIYALEKDLWDNARAIEHILGLWNPNKFPAWKSFLHNHGLDLSS